MKYYIIAAFLLFAASSAWGQKSDYKIRAKGLQLVVAYEGRAHTLNTVEQIDAALVTEAEILFADRKDGFTYLVIDVSGQSKKKQDDRQCGAGTESNLLWIKLDAAWKIADINSARYESCWSSVDSLEGYRINKNVLTIEFNNFRDDLNVKISYDSNQPEKGFRIEQKALENK
jgi:hypothetical protein